jgi:hypothetical protein
MLGIALDRHDLAHHRRLSDVHRLIHLGFDAALPCARDFLHESVFVVSISFVIPIPEASL